MPETINKITNDVLHNFDNFIDKIMENNIDDYIALHCGNYEDDPINTTKCRGCN